MGTLGGHLLPGTFFIIFAIWWGFITSLRYVQNRYNSSRLRKQANGSSNGGTRGGGDKSKSGGLIEYQSTVWMPCVCLPCGPRARRAPIESWLKGVLAFIALLIEAYTAVSFHKVKYNSPSDGNSMPSMGHGEHDHGSGGESGGGGEHEHSHVHERSADMMASSGASDAVVMYTWTFEKGNAQHITMYTTFVLGSILEIMMYHGVDLPKNIDYAMGILAFGIEGFLFANHLHGKEPIEVFLHVLLVYAIFACVFACALEAWNDKQILFTYARCVFTLLQGTWFYQVGFMLYPPTDNPAWHYNMSDHGLIMVVTVCYCWHVLLIVMGFLLQYWFVRRIYLGASDRLRARLDDLIYIDRINRQTKGGNFLPTESGAKQTNGGSNLPLFAMNSEDEDVHLVMNHHQEDEN